jgi:hypothetical protein
MFDMTVGAEDFYARGQSHYNTFALFFDSPSIKEKVFLYL